VIGIGLIGLHAYELDPGTRQDVPMANVTFSVCAGLASLAIAIIAAVKGVYVVTAVWALLAVGFAIRAAYGLRKS